MIDIDKTHGKHTIFDFETENLKPNKKVTLGVN